MNARTGPSEERLRIEIQRYCSRRSQVPGVMGLDRQEKKKRETSLVSGCYRVWEELRGTLGVFLKKWQCWWFPSSSQNTCGRYPLCCCRRDFLFRFKSLRPCKIVYLYHPVPFLLSPFFPSLYRGLALCLPSSPWAWAVQWPLYLPGHSHTPCLSFLSTFQGSPLPVNKVCASDLVSEGPLLPCQALFCLFIVIVHLITGMFLVALCCPLNTLHALLPRWHCPHDSWEIYAWLSQSWAIRSSGNPDHPEGPSSPRINPASSCRL